MFNNLSSPKSYRKGSWSHEEHQQFITALQHVGKDWPRMGEYVTTRSSVQIRSHGQKYFGKLETMFESKEILGEEFEAIKGPVNDRQYRLYLDLVRPKPNLISKSTSPEPSEVQLIDSIKYQLVDAREHQSPLPPSLTRMECEPPNQFPTPKRPTEQGYFTQIASQQFGVQNMSSVNFFQTFVEKSSSTHSWNDWSCYQQFLLNYPQAPSQKGFVSYNRRSAPQMETNRPQ